MWSIALSAFVLGIAYAAVPGAVNTESIRRTLHGGSREGFLIQIGALAGDATWAIVGLTGMTLLLQGDSIAGILGLVSATLLLWLAGQALRGAINPSQAPQSARSGGSLRVGLAFGLANPAGIAFWSGFGATIFSGDPPNGTSLVIVLTCFIAGATTWGATLVKLIAWGGQRAGQRFLPIVDAICAVLLGWFGVRWLWSAIQRLKPFATPLVRALT